MNNDLINVDERRNEYDELINQWKDKRIHFWLKMNEWMNEWVRYISERMGELIDGNVELMN